MRKFVMAVGALALLGGTALAAQDPYPTDTTLRRHWVSRWAFDGAGPTESQVAYRDCSSGKLVTVNTRRTAGDWTLAVLSAGWYTPEHTTVQCSMR